MGFINVTERMKHFHVPGVSVSYFEHGKIQWSKCFGVLEQGAPKKVDDNSIFHACSISKMITALCVLKLAQEGKLDLHKNVNDYLTSWQIPDNEFTEKNKVTLAHLLSHQAGFYDCEGSFAPYVQGDEIPKPIDILKGTTRYNQEAVMVKYIPGTDCEYSDAGYSVIALILEDIFGESIPRIAKRLVFNPLGLQRTFFWELNEEQLEQGQPDQGHLFQGQLNKGQPNQEQLNQGQLNQCYVKHINLTDCVVGHDNNGDIVDETRACYPNIEGAALWTTPNELALIVLDLIKAYHGKDSKILNSEMGRFMLTPFGCVTDVGMGVFLEADEAGKPYFYSQGWGVGMQCKLRAYYQDQRGVVVMTNSEPGMEQDESLIGGIIHHVSTYLSL